MAIDRTQTQDDEQSRRAQQLSLQRTRPPIDVPGYEPEGFLGAGAYGEVWVAVDRNTGRRVAIKFYAHRGGLDWSLLSREVEKLVFLSADRYVVQLLDVGWDADPPYYVMEYVEQGSLEDRLRAEGSLPVGEAVGLFKEVAIGLLHAHGKGVLHCDLKPANVLLDQDTRPRLADFGQSRLSHEQSPALGTLFYMAPEQADLTAVPDARWDVYALGALLYAMLTGAPPHRTDEATTEIETAPNLEQRLSRYRRHIEQAPLVTGHRNVPGVDRALAEIIDGCLAVEPKKRFPNVQAVIEALDARELRRARRPLVLLGMIGPALLMLVMGLAAWQGLDTVIRHADDALTARALESNRFAAQLAAKAAANDLDRRYRDVEQAAADPTFKSIMASFLANEEIGPLRNQLNASNADDGPLRERFRNHPAREALQRELEKLYENEQGARVASWFVNDAHGLQIARHPENEHTVGRNYAWRTYFHGGPADHSPDWQPAPDQHIERTTLSAVFRSQATGRWIISVSHPVWHEDQFLGIVAITSQIGWDFGVRVSEQDNGSTKEQFAVLVDQRSDENLILQHHLFERLLKNEGKLPDRFAEMGIDPDALPGQGGKNGSKTHYRDPLGSDPGGADYRGLWLAEMAPVMVRGENSGLSVIVQETKDRATGRTLELLRNSLLWIGVLALGVMALVLTLLWAFVTRALGSDGAGMVVPARNGTATPATPTVDAAQQVPGTKTP